jgi:hypothetical protein
VFHVTAASVVGISDLTIRNGHPAAGAGGGVLVLGFLPDGPPTVVDLIDVEVVDNEVDFGFVGGGVAVGSNPRVTVRRSLVARNKAGSAGAWQHPPGSWTSWSRPCPSRRPEGTKRTRATRITNRKGMAPWLANTWS